MRHVHRLHKAHKSSALGMICAFFIVRTKKVGVSNGLIKRVQVVEVVLTTPLKCMTVEATCREPVILRGTHKRTLLLPTAFARA